MARVRRPDDRMDGAAVLPHNRPPTELIPATFGKLMAEYDQLRTEYEHASQDLREMDENWVVLRQEAIRADARSAMTATRDGRPIPVNAAVDALDARRESVRARRAGLAIAVEALPSDLNEVRYAEQANPAYTDQVTKARAELRKATAQVRAKTQALAQAVSLREWIFDQKPWDARTQFAATDIVPGLGSILGYQNNPPTTDAAALLDAIDNL